MAFSVRRENGIEINYEDTRIVLDSTRKPNQPIFVTHAHGDHCSGLKWAEMAYATKATFNLARYKKDEQERYTIEYNRSFHFGDIEVKPYNAGHILGSTQYEMITSTGNVVYTGDINFRDTLLTKRAEVIPCDLLIIESTYGTPCYFPSRDYMYERIIKWAKTSIKNGKIPTFQTDALGNAQELIALLNKYTKLPVITHSTISKYNNIYEKFGYKLKFVDENDCQAQEISRTKEYVLIHPKNTHNTRARRKDLEIAFVSGWGSRFSGNRKAFSLSDHSDFYRLLEYVEKTNPREVLTCHGSLRSKLTLAKKIRKMLHISSSPLTKAHHTTSTTAHIRSIRLAECINEILINVKPGFIYPKKWLITTSQKSLRRFSQEEIEWGLSESVKEGRLLYFNDSDSYELKSYKSI